MAETEHNAEQNEKDNQKRAGAMRALKSGAQRLTLGLGSSALVLITATAIALVAIASLAWLSKNRDVDSGSMAMDMDNGLFDVGVVSVNSERKYAVETEALNALPVAYSKVDMKTGDATGVNGVICALVSDGAPVSGSVNLDGGMLQPGATGKLTFLIYPTENNLNYQTTISLSAVTYSQTGGSQRDYISDESIAAGDDRADALRLMKGHILFFSNRTEIRDGNNEVTGYSYPAGSWISPDSKVYITGASAAGSCYEVTLYWEWPVTYERLTQINTDYSSHQSRYFIEDSKNPGAYLENSLGYDSADSEIGKHILYCVAELAVSKTATSQLETSIPVVAAQTPQ